MTGSAIFAPAVSSSATDSVFSFQTTDVTVELRSHAGALIDTGTASYYANGWHTIGDTSGGQVHVEMLSGSYAFAMVLLGTREQKDGIAVGTSPTTVTFTAGQVHSDTGTATQYYAGSWRPFTQDMQLLAGTYPFRFNDGTPQTDVTLSGGIVNTIH